MSASVTRVTGVSGHTTSVQVVDSNVTTVQYSAPANITRVTEGMPGPVGPSGSNSFFLFTQGVASDTWVIEHNLGFRPNFRTFDSTDEEVEGEVTHDSNNQITVVFSVPISGYATIS